MAREIGNFRDVLQALEFDDLVDCDEIQLLKPWLENIQLENVLSSDEEEALYDCEALGFSPEEVNEKIKQKGIDPKYLDTTDEEIVLLENELNALELIDTTTDNERHVCEKLEKILKELQEKNESASNSLQKTLDSCLEQWENIQSDRQKFCNIVQEMTQMYFSDVSGDDFEDFLLKYDENVQSFHKAVLDIVGDKFKIQNPEVKTECELLTEGKCRESAPSGVGHSTLEAISRMKKSLALQYYTSMNNYSGIDQMATMESKFCLREYANPETTLRLKLLLLCEELAEQTVALKVLIPKSKRRYELKQQRLDYSRQLQKLLREQRELHQFVAVLLSVWNLEKKELYTIVKETSMFYEQDNKHSMSRTTALEAAKHKFLAYVHSPAFEEGCLPAGLWRAARLFGIRPEHHCSLRSAAEAEEEKIRAALQKLDDDLSESERKTKMLETQYYEVSGSALEQENLVRQMKVALEESEEVLRTQKERHENFKAVAQRDEGSKMIRLCWAYFLTESPKLLEVADKLKRENSNLCHNLETPLQSSTPRSSSDVL